MASKTTMRRYVISCGGYYSGKSARWCFVGRFGAAYFANLKEAYAKIDEAVAGQYYDPNGNWAYEPRNVYGLPY